MHACTHTSLAMSLFVLLIVCVLRWGVALVEGPLSPLFSTLIGSTNICNLFFLCIHPTDAIIHDITPSLFNTLHSLNGIFVYVLCTVYTTARRVESSSPAIHFASGRIRRSRALVRQVLSGCNFHLTILPGSFMPAAYVTTSLPPPAPRGQGPGSHARLPSPSWPI